MVNKYKISMRKLAEVLIERRSKNYDCVIIVDGPRGNGKSTFLYRLFSHLGEFIPERDIVFSREDLIERMKSKFGLIMQDEMINAAHNRDFYEKDQKMLIKMLNMYRDNYNIMGGAVPFFYDLDPQVRKFVALRVTITERGRAILQKAKSSMFTNDPWETDVNKKLEMKMQGVMKRGKIMKLNYSKLTTFWGTLDFGPLGKRQEARYLKIKETKRNTLMGEEPEKEEKEKSEMQSLAEKYEAGYIGKKDIEIYCRLHDKQYHNIMNAIHKRLKNLRVMVPRQLEAPLVSQAPYG